MRTLMGISMVFGVMVAVSFVAAQPPNGPGGSGSADATQFITRMMTLDTNQDGSLSKDEVTDTRLTSLFARADADNDGVVTKSELKTLFDKEGANLNRGGGPGFGGGPGGGPGGPGFGGGPGRSGGPGGPGGPMMGGPPPIGQVLPQPIQEMLKLNNAQKKKLEALQKHVDAKLDSILTDEQKQQLEDMKNRGPGAPGGPGGFGPPGGPGAGGPPGGRGGPPPDRPQRPSDN